MFFKLYKWYQIAQRITFSQKMSLVDFVQEALWFFTEGLYSPPKFSFYLKYYRSFQLTKIKLAKYELQRKTQGCEQFDLVAS